MTLWNHRDALMCRIFPSSLHDVAHKWFKRLPHRSIKNFKSLAELFTARFITNSSHPKRMDALLTMKKMPQETLREYAKRYWELFNEIEDCLEGVAVASFEIGLPSSSLLYESLTKKEATTIDDLMARIKKYAKVEDVTRLSTGENG